MCITLRSGSFVDLQMREPFITTIFLLLVIVILQLMAAVAFSY